MEWNVKKIEDEQEHVIKYVFNKSDAVAESVLYRYPTYEERTVICCSTQSGCPVGCRFCGAGDAFVRSLTTDEIVEQAVFSVEETGVDPNNMERLQIMFMSMGEPLLNLKHLVPALRKLYALYPRAALLISTSGPNAKYDLVNEISKEIPTVGLQFSVHESTDVRRDNLIPFRAKLNLKEIAETGTRWFEATGRKPFFNYCASDENSSDDDADRIRELFDPSVWEATISVICERDEGMEARNEFQRSLATDFSNKLLEREFNVRVFDPAGQDTIGGGCGQLWFVQKWMDDNKELTRPTAGTGKDSVHVPAL